MPRPDVTGRRGLILAGDALRPRRALLERTVPAADVICLAGSVATVLELERAGVLWLPADAEERAAVRRAAHLLEAAEARGAVVVAPDDVVAYRDYPTTRAYVSGTPADLRPGWVIGDVGHRTLAAFRDALAGLDTVVWTGSLGTAREHPFARGSIALARLLSRGEDGRAPRLIVAGRDTVEVVRAAGVEVVPGQRNWWAGTPRAASGASTLRGRRSDATDANDDGRTLR